MPACSPMDKAGAVVVTGAASGIGLTEAKKMIEAADGTIDLTSSEGAGTRAEIALPMVV